MHIEELKTKNGEVLSGPLLLTPTVFSDSRGCFFESWNQSSWETILSNYGQKSKPFVQDNHSVSARGVLRGLHYQINPHPQAKLVRSVVGKIFDVALDIRCSSITFGKWVGAILSDNNKQQLWIPEGFAHGFLVLSDKAEVIYKTTDFWNRDSERSICWDDLQLAITWPDCSREIQLSEKDRTAFLLENIAKEDLFL